MFILNSSINTYMCTQLKQKHYSDIAIVGCYCVIALLELVQYIFNST